MKRTFCLLLALLLVLALGAQAFADDALYCRICGSQIPADSNFCPYCAAAVVRADGSAATSTHLPGKSPSPATSVPADPGPFNSNVRTGASGKLRVTKSPTSESVPYGGSCIFIAHADNASSITWYIANADASVICEAGEAASANNGLYVSGSKTDTLSLSGIPSWMNGYQVQACFAGTDGKVYTDVAKIWTYAPVQEKCCSCWCCPEWWYLCPVHCDCPWLLPWWDPCAPPPPPPDKPGPGPIGPEPPLPDKPEPDKPPLPPEELPPPPEAPKSETPPTSLDLVIAELENNFDLDPELVKVFS